MSTKRGAEGQGVKGHSRLAGARSAALRHATIPGTPASAWRCRADPSWPACARARPLRCSKEAEANRWLARFVAAYNRGDHRSEPHSRIDDWLAHLPADGVRQMCAWERFCVFAREPERRLVGIDCRLTVAAVTYEVDAELAGETWTEASDRWLARSNSI
jgi:hypothetical protein